MIFILILSIYALSFTIRNLPGPFNIFGILRNWFMRLPFFIGVFFYQLLECSWCVGFHSGYIVYAIYNHHLYFSDFLIWGLAGAAISAIMDAALGKLSGENGSSQ